MDGQIVGFSIADVQANNIWALFVQPEYKGKGIGKSLHILMPGWYFSQTQKTVWLGTGPGTLPHHPGVYSSSDQNYLGALLPEIICCFFHKGH
jgi:GNAT superfamily N-acetyltransferase